MALSGCSGITATSWLESDRLRESDRSVFLRPHHFHLIGAALSLPMASQSTIVTSATIAAGTVAAASLAVHRALSAGPYSSWSSVVFGSSSAPYSELNLSKPDSKDGKIHVDIHESGYSLTGTIEPGYERVVEAFLKNVAEGQEVGASYCFYVGGKPVVDLAGGLKDKDGREYDLKSGWFREG